MKIISAKSIGVMPVYDLFVDHEDHSFVHEAGVVVHNCAMVVTNEPVSNFIPLTTVSGYRTTQYDAHGVEARGGIKMDFLGLNSLKDIQECIRLIQKTTNGEEPDAIIDRKKVPGFRIVPFEGQLYDIWDLPEDQGVFKDIAEGKTETVFQLNTNSARQWLKQFNYEKANGNKSIDSIASIAAFTALDRPGPLDAEVTDPETEKSHNMLVEYAHRARGLPSVGNIPALDELLPETFGVLVFQEGLEKVYKELTGCDGIEAGKFRTLVAKKQVDDLKKSYPKFIERASAKIGQAQAQQVWDQMVTFGAYGFNLSHSVCYAIVAYACAFLKHHFPLEWWTAVLCNADKKEIAEILWAHCSHYIDLPDIQFSGTNFEIQNGRIRAPLSFLHGVGPGAHAELMSYRPFTTIEELCRKINLHKKNGAVPAIDKATGQQKVDKKGNLKWKKGTTALNSGVMAKLIVSGVAESLFPSELCLTERLELFLNCMASTANELEGTKVKPGKLNPKYLNLSALTRYQLQKEILPIFSEDLQDAIYDTKLHGMTPAGKSDSVRYTYLPFRSDVVDEVLKQKTGRMYEEPLPVVTGAQLRTLNSIAIEDPINVAAAAYVLATRVFSYQSGSKTAMEVLFDVNGEQFKYVKWPDRKTGKLTVPDGIGVGAIVMVMLNRWDSEKPFSVDAIIVVQPVGVEEPEEGEEE